MKEQGSDGSKCTTDVVRIWWPLRWESPTAYAHRFADKCETSS